MNTEINGKQRWSSSIADSTIIFLWTHPTYILYNTPYLKIPGGEMSGNWRLWPREVCVQERGWRGLHQIFKIYKVSFFSILCWKWKFHKQIFYFIMWPVHLWKKNWKKSTVWLTFKNILFLLRLVRQIPVYFFTLMQHLTRYTINRITAYHLSVLFV